MKSEYMYPTLRASTDESPKPTLCMLTAVDATLSITGAKLDNVQFSVIRIIYNALLRITTHD